MSMDGWVRFNSIFDVIFSTNMGEGSLTVGVRFIGMCVVLLVFVGVVVSVLPVGVAADYVETFSVDVSALGYRAYSLYCEKDTGLIGYFEVTSGGNKDIDFFIVDSENYEKFTNLQEFTCYCLHEKVTSLSWIFETPYADTWYIVFDNSFSLLTVKHVEGWLGIDRTPPEITINLEDGETVSEVVTIMVSASDEYFDVEYLEIQIDGETVVYDYNTETLSYSWKTTDYKNGYHTITVVARDSVGNSGSLTITVNVDNPVSLVPSGASAADYGLLLLIGMVVGVAVVLVSLTRRKPSVKVEQTGLPGPVTSTAPKQEIRNICPRCGAENPPDAKFCTKCGSPLAA